MFREPWRIALKGGQQGLQVHQPPTQIKDVQKAAAAITAGLRREPKARTHRKVPTRGEQSVPRTLS